MEGGKTCNTECIQEYLERPVGKPKFSDADLTSIVTKEWEAVSSRRNKPLLFAGSAKCLRAHLQCQYLASASEKRGASIHLQSACSGTQVHSLYAFALSNLPRKTV